MPSSRDILDTGQPAYPNPIELTPELLQYGLTLAGLLGTAASPTGYGTFFARDVSRQTGIAVSGGSVTLAERGPVLAVEATDGASIGPKPQAVIAAQSGFCLVTYDATGLPTITFDAADAVTECAVAQLITPSSLATFLAADAPEPPA